MKKKPLIKYYIAAALLAGFILALYLVRMSFISLPAPGKVLGVHTLDSTHNAYFLDSSHPQNTEQEENSQDIIPPAATEQTENSQENNHFRVTVSQKSGQKSSLKKRATKTTPKFKDINLSPYKDAIEELAKKGILIGYPDGSYRPAKRVSRAEMVKIIVEAMGTDSSKIKKYDKGGCLRDIPPVDVSGVIWYSGYVCWAYENKIISGYADKTFRPYDMVSVAEAVKIALSAFGYTIKKTEPWTVGVMEKVKNLDILSKSKKGSDPVNRGEMAEIVFRTAQAQFAKY